MRIGVNVTSAQSFAFATGADVDFYELLFDNFLHLDPRCVAEEVGDAPVAIHMMGTAYATHDHHLDYFADAVRAWCRAMEVLYVSDHLLLVLDEHGRQLPQMREIEYDHRRVFDRAARWQERLGVPLVLENFASESPDGLGQVAFFSELWRTTGVRPLFDFSNAVIAELNGGDPVSLWVDSGLPLRTCHVSGYRPSWVHPGLIIDSHDAPVSDESLDLIARVVADQGPPETLVVERDGELEVCSWAADLDRVRAVVGDVGGMTCRTD